MLRTKEAIEKSVLKFYSKYGFPQSIGAIDGTDVAIKQPSENATDYINRKGRYTVNIQAVVDFKYCLTDVMIEWPGSVHDARMFSTSTLSSDIRNGSISRDEKVILEGEPSVSICLPGDPAYLLLPCLMKEYANGRKGESEEFFGFRLSSAWMVIECAFGQLKARFGCLRIEMDINIRELPNLINSCIVLNNFSKERKEPFNQKHVNIALNYDKEFKPPSDSSYKVSNNETGGKVIRQIYMKHFE